MHQNEILHHGPDVAARYHRVPGFDSSPGPIISDPLPSSYIKPEWLLCLPGNCHKSSPSYGPAPRSTACRLHPSRQRVEAAHLLLHFTARHILIVSSSINSPILTLPLGRRSCSCHTNFVLAEPSLDFPSYSTTKTLTNNSRRRWTMSLSPQKAFKHRQLERRDHTFRHSTPTRGS